MSADDQARRELEEILAEFRDIMGEIIISGLNEEYKKDIGEGFSLRLKLLDWHEKWMSKVLEVTPATWRTLKDPKPTVSREKLEELLIGHTLTSKHYGEEYRDGLHVRHFLDDLLALLNCNEEKKCCEHLVWDSGNGWCLSGIGPVPSAVNWKLCPICGAKKPE